MAYQAWSVVFGEQPTAAKWNILGTNDASFHDGTGIDDDAILARHIANLAVSNPQMAADTFLWEILGKTTLGVAGDTISVTPITAKKYLRVYIFVTATGGTINTGMRFNNDSGNNYASRSSLNGGADGTGASTSLAGMAGTVAAAPKFVVVDIVNVLAQEKLLMSWCIEQNTAGAANVPIRAESVNKWANTAAQITRVDVVNSGGTGDFAIGSEVVVLGHD